MTTSSTLSPGLRAGPGIRSSSCFFCSSSSSSRNNFLPRLIIIFSSPSFLSLENFGWIKVFTHILIPFAVGIFFSCASLAGCGLQRPKLQDVLFFVLPITNLLFKENPADFFLPWYSNLLPHLGG